MAGQQPAAPYWELAPSLSAARQEANSMFPGRSTRSDGTIGDKAHRERASDHNPDPKGMVHALDLTHDPAHGCDCARLSQHIAMAHDRRVRYLIWNGHILLGPGSTSVRHRVAPAWRWMAYNGPDPHTSHLHISVGYDRVSERSTTRWFH